MKLDNKITKTAEIEAVNIRREILLPHPLQMLGQLYLCHFWTNIFTACSEEEDRRALPQTPDKRLEYCTAAHSNTDLPFCCVMSDLKWVLRKNKLLKSYVLYIWTLLLSFPFLSLNICNPFIFLLVFDFSRTLKCLLLSLEPLPWT